MKIKNTLNSILDKTPTFYFMAICLFVSSRYQPHWFVKWDQLLSSALMHDIVCERYDCRLLTPKLLHNPHSILIALCFSAVLNFQATHKSPFKQSKHQPTHKKTQTPFTIISQKPQPPAAKSVPHTPRLYHPSLVPYLKVRYCLIEMPASPLVFAVVVLELALPGSNYRCRGLLWSLWGMLRSILPVFMIVGGWTLFSR